MYVWKLLGHDTSECSQRSGIGDDLAPIMRAIEAELTAPAGFIGHVAEVVPRLSVSHLGTIHVPTGREWLGRRSRSGGVHWAARYRPVEPGVACDLPEFRDRESTARGAIT